MYLFLYLTIPHNLIIHYLKHSSIFLLLTYLHSNISKHAITSLPHHSITCATVFPAPPSANLALPTHRNPRCSTKLPLELLSCQYYQPCFPITPSLILLFIVLTRNTLLRERRKVGMEMNTEMTARRKCREIEVMNWNEIK